MTEYDPHGSVDRWVRFWDEQGVFRAKDVGDAGDADARYIVSMLPYPSGDLHMGHAEVYSISDAMARFQRMRGHNVLNPIGWDSFGLPAENAALKRGLDPRSWTYDNIAVQAESFKRLGISFDWSTRLHTSDPEYYRWNQWIFLRMFERGLAYRKSAPVNWCPKDATVLANEQVIGGTCERCGTVVVRRNLNQWFFKITSYAQHLLDDMDQLTGSWPDDILAMQRNWIGRSEGAYIDFDIDQIAETVRVFSTRPDTIYGATCLVVAADAPLAATLCLPQHKDELETYRQNLDNVSAAERLASDRPIAGVLLGTYAINPMSGERIPVYASDYVLADYGTGAIMAVPAHDERDLNFAHATGLPVRTVIDTGQTGDLTGNAAATARIGTLINSGQFDGMCPADAAHAITEALVERGRGEFAVIYQLRDWLLSRQRYWGTPIPIVHCPECGEVPVADDQLPVLLPVTGYDLRPPEGETPLESATEWVNTTCPKCGGDARRDADTMDTFVDSSWYFLRYLSPHFKDGPFDPAAVERWMPVDEYIGGKEHATGHLIYSRFFTKVLFDMGMVSFTEPFTRLTNQGQVIMGGKAMSKSLGNLVNLQDQIARFGPDAVRVTMLFAGPADEDIDWADVSPTGATKWLARIWRLVDDVSAAPAATDTAVDDVTLRREVHKLIDETTKAMESKRFNVAIARQMELTNILRKAYAQTGPTSPAIREGVDALVRMVSPAAPFLAESAWERLGNTSSVAMASWPEADPALLVEDEVTCVIQVNGKVRDRIQVPETISKDDLENLARHRATTSEKLKNLITNPSCPVVIREPRLVNFVAPKLKG